MEAKGSRRGSYSWKSILKGMDVIAWGACWWIGDGKSVKIWKHLWFLVKHPTILSSFVVESLQEATIDLLINSSMRQQNTDMIDDIFVPQEAEAIKKIPLAYHTTTNSLFRHLAQDRNYSLSLAIVFLDGDRA